MGKVLKNVNLTTTEKIKGINFSKINGNCNNGKILIFLPGIGAIKENYFQHLNSFVDFYNSIYALDLPEQGSVGNWSIGDMVENLIVFIKGIDNFRIQTIHLAGHSAGAVAIVSFLANYNRLIENRLVYLKEEENLNPIIEAKKEGFLGNIPESSKVEKVILYSPPTSFSNRLTKRIILSNISKSQFVIKFILNFFVNIPMILFKPFTSSRKTDFILEKSNRPQYYYFIMDNFRRFFEYTTSYQTIFELAYKSEYKLQLDISELLSNKKILIQYGSFDWLIKLFLLRKRKLVGLYSISPNVEIVKQNWLGHFLRKRYHLDLNLNNQMITNRNVIKESLRFVNN